MRYDDSYEPSRAAARSAYAVLALTSIHHAYGAYVYHTPWRLHVVPVAIITAIVIAMAHGRSRRSVPSSAAWWVFAIVTLVVPILAIGAFEGFYNHALKNLLYFGGAPHDIMMTLFPPPAYEMPNDAFFEITGVLQTVPAAMSAWYLLHAILSRPRSSPAIELPKEVPWRHRME